MRPPGTFLWLKGRTSSELSSFWSSVSLFLAPSPKTSHFYVRGLKQRGRAGCCSERGGGGGGGEHPSLCAPAALRQHLLLQDAQWVRAVILAALMGVKHRFPHSTREAVLELIPAISHGWRLSPFPTSCLPKGTEAVLDYFKLPLFW